MISLLHPLRIFILFEDIDRFYKRTVGIVSKVSPNSVNKGVYLLQVSRCLVLGVGVLLFVC